MSSLHGVTAGLPAHQRVLPSVAAGEDVPVHFPLPGVPVSGLGGVLGGLVDAHGAARELDRGARDDIGVKGLVGFAVGGV